MILPIWFLVIRLIDRSIDDQTKESILQLDLHNPFWSLKHFKPALPTNQAQAIIVIKKKYVT